MFLAESAQLCVIWGLSLPPARNAPCRTEAQRRREHATRSLSPMSKIIDAAANSTSAASAALPGFPPDFSLQHLAFSLAATTTTTDRDCNALMALISLNSLMALIS
jgi:hypothetical protein